MDNISTTKYSLIVSSIVGLVFALLYFFIVRVVMIKERDLIVLLVLSLVISPILVFLLYRKVRSLLKYKDAVLISLYGLSFFGLFLLIILPRYRSFYALTLTLYMIPVNILLGAVTARFLKKKKNEILRKVIFTIGIVVVTSVVVIASIYYIEEEYAEYERVRHYEFINEITIVHPKYLEEDNKAYLEMISYSYNNIERKVGYKIKIAVQSMGLTFIEDGREKKEVIIATSEKPGSYWSPRIQLKISPEYTEKPEGFQIALTILDRTDKEVDSKTLTLVFKKWSPATKNLMISFVFFIVLAGLSGTGRELFLIFRLIAINRRYESFDRLSKWVTEDYLFALKEIKKTMKDIYSSERDFILQAIDTGDKRNKNEAISKLLRHLLLVTESLQETEKVGYGRKYIVGLSDAFELLNKAKKSYILAIDSKILRGVLQKMVDNWLENIDFLKSTTFGEAIFEFALKTKEIFINRPEILEVSLSNTGSGPAMAVTIKISTDSENLSIEGSDKIRKYLISENEEFSTKFTITANTAARLPVNFEINYLDQASNSKNINIDESINALSKHEESDFKEIINPYEFGKPIKTKDMFFGRQDIIRRIKEEVGDKDSPTQPIAIIGQRRIGKTSILYQIKRQLSNKFIICFIDIQKTNPRMPYVLFYKILDEVKKEFNKHTNAKFPVMAILNKDYEESGVYLSFESDLSKLDEYLEEKGLPPIVFLLDEVESLRAFEKESDMMGFFRGLIQSSHRLLFIVSGSDLMFKLTTDYASPFYNLFSTVECKELTEGETRKLIIEPTLAQEMRYSDDRVIKFIIESTGCNPYLTQALCNYIIRLLNREKKYEVSLTDVERAIENFVSQQKAFFLYLWGKTSPLGRLILYYFAKIDSNQTPEEILRSINKETKIKINLSQISEEIKLLIEGRVLIAGGYEKEQINSYWFTNRLFPRWIEITNEAKIKKILKEIPKGAYSNEAE